ncbi:uncharacterized protein LOC112091690 [Morus notabilis]|uniref:uncharacterized protein LOC112091690 n=1 Tax=Morus notabilis TaxID=981085 RepID=UPI000CECEA85|nr:uncharacterized protein LOC112091690 [Morus notabilis]
MESLEVMFGAPSEKARLDAVRAFMNEKMKKGISVKVHILNMIDHLHEAGLSGTRIDEATQVGIILESLSLDFHEFINNYVMNKKRSNLTELLNDLQNFESTNKSRGGEANVVIAGGSGKNKGRTRTKAKGRRERTRNLRRPKALTRNPRESVLSCPEAGVGDVQARLRVKRD